MAVDTTTDPAHTGVVEGGHVGGPSPTRRRLTTVGGVFAGLAIGLAAAFVGSQVLGGEDDEPVAEVADSRTLDGEVTGPADLLPEGTPVPDGAGAESAEAAITGFLDAEVADDFETSFGYLDDAGRAEFGSPAGWVASHANELPPITGYELGERQPADDGREIIAAVVEFEPGLDQVIGLVPARATVQWDVTRGADGGWGVSLGTSAFTPEYPPDTEVPGAVQQWLAARQQCETPDNERDGLVGSPSLANALCDVDGDVAVGEVETLDELGAQPIFTAFGEDTVGASRSVRLSGPVEMAVVLAPIGDQWTVIGVLP